VWTDSEVARLFAIYSPPASPLSPWSSPPPQIPFPPLPPILSPPSPASPPSPIRSLGYRAAMIRLIDEAASISSPPSQLPSASRREDRPEVTLPHRKRLDIALGPRYEVGESSSAAAARPAGVGYGITDSWDEIVETLQGAPVSTDTELGGYVREFETRVRQDMDEIYTRLDDEQTERQLLAGWLNMLFRDRRAHAYTRQLMETEARMSREAWVRATDASDLVHGTEGVASLSQWCKRMESVFHISNCTAENQVKFATCTLHSVALTWWNSHVQTVGHEAAYSMSWKTLMKIMTDKYCPQNEIRKLEMELWELKVKGTDLASYTQRFQELALLCGRMFSEESDKIEKYVRGLPDIIHGSVVASKPKMMQEAIEIATELMDKKVRTFAERETTSKRKFENTSRTTRNQQQHLNKRQNTVRVYTAASGGKKQYEDPNLHALNAIITTTVHVLLSATTTTKLVILQVTVGMWQIPIMQTTKGALSSARSLHVMSVELEDIIEGNVPS
nr:reverse transcriptase domain-containing protein [Tanacetum cinerariifolium]